jgi:outer membrane protein assembly factor BamD
MTQRQTTSPLTMAAWLKRAPRAWFSTLALSLVVSASLGLSACGTTKEEENTAASVEALYRDAQNEVAAGGYDKALKLYERLEGRAAGTLLAQQALLEQAYINHRLRERAAASVAVERFIKLHPSSPVMDYAMYLRGLINFNDNLGFLGNLSRQKLTERDQQASRDAHQAFKLLVETYPESKYAADARVRMDYIVNALAEYEVHVARYYFNRGAWMAAANRAQQALTEFPQVPANEDALHILVASYDKLGLVALRDDAQRVLAKNFPDSRASASRGRIVDTPWWKFW